MRIDSHQHFWNLERGDYGWLTAELGPIFKDFGAADLKPLIDAAGVDGTIIVQAASTVAETDFMLSIADQHDWILGVVGWVDFDAPDQAMADLERLSENPKFVGVRPPIENMDDHQWLLRSGHDPVFKKMMELGLTFDALGRVWLLDVLIEFFGRYPDLPCVIDHCAKPLIAEGTMQPWADQMAEIAKNTNVLCKLSGLTTEAASGWEVGDITAYVEHVLRSFGTDRVMFGSDWPVVRLQSDYAEWVDLVDGWLKGYSDGERAAVLGGNAARFYLG